MPTIFDLFGFPVDDRSSLVEAIRKARMCPFMGAICDGGGNRFQTKIKLTDTEPLTHYFNSDVSEVVPGVCSIKAGNDIWVVCPRRLLAFRSSEQGLPLVNHALQAYERDLLISAGISRGIDIGIWSEVVIKQSIDDAEINYHFDYIAAPIIKLSIEDFLRSQKMDEETFEKYVEELIQAARIGGYFSKGQRNPSSFAIVLPDITSPFILEVMTASTSGSDTVNQTDMRSAFRNAILTDSHTSPGINKRQVWGRMVTQLFAKTALAHNWGGRTVWIIQDELLRNIELTTRLKTSNVQSTPQRNISLVVMRYDVSSDGSRNLSFKTKIDGDAGLDFGGNESFTDILLPKTSPPKIELLKAILRRKIGGIVNL